MSPLEELVQTFKHLRFAVLTGAGISTESGIPDYRGPTTRHKERNPITFQQFSRDPEMRKRYWARSRYGWPKIKEARPNRAHTLLSQLEESGSVSGIITQNVDRLHTAAGSRSVIELHGALEEVVCLSCHTEYHRDDVQQMLEELNGPTRYEALEIAPDGDSDIAPTELDDFITPTCTSCDGILKPHVVFFGENVNPTDRDAAFDMVDDAEALLVVGTSLHVYSGLRFVKHAGRYKKPIGIINLGDTRGDPLAWVCADVKASDGLAHLAGSLLTR